MNFPVHIKNLIYEYRNAIQNTIPYDQKSEILSNIISAVSVIKKLDYRPTICPNLSKLRDALGKYPKGRRVSEVFTNKNFCFNYTSDFPADIRNLIEQYKASTQDSQKSEILSNIISALEN